MQGRGSILLLTTGESKFGPAPRWSANSIVGYAGSRISASTAHANMEATDSVLSVSSPGSATASLFGESVPF